jgi:UrcA family protein
MTARSLIFSMVAAAALYPASASAASIVVEAAPSVKVSFADLDIGAETGRETLSRRIAVAAKQVCGTPSERNLKFIMANTQCRKEAVSSANLQVEQLLATRFAAVDRSLEVRGTN